MVENQSDNGSAASEDSEMESFEDYKPRIEELLRDIRMAYFDIKELQHGYRYQNCVYALVSSIDPTEQCVLCIPLLPDLNDKGKCEAIENDAALLGYLADKLPVPNVKVYDSTMAWWSSWELAAMGLTPILGAAEFIPCRQVDRVRSRHTYIHDSTIANILEKPYTDQSRLLGVSLDELWDEVASEEKVMIIYHFVALLAKIEFVHFTTAGTFTASSSVPALQHTASTSTPPITFFNEGDENFVKTPGMAEDRSGQDLRRLLVSHLKGWIEKESKLEKSYSLESLRLVLSMINDLNQEGAFKPTPCPIVLHHLDLEPRNIMVSKTADDVWEIAGVIDWDSALALPRPLAR
ncbi:MAG: hypothetical protein Q9209_004835 [Squamulea sp. 1 TL-2023]